MTSSPESQLPPAGDSVTCLSCCSSAALIASLSVATVRVLASESLCAAARDACSWDSTSFREHTCKAGRGTQLLFGGSKARGQSHDSRWLTCKAAYPYSGRNPQRVGHTLSKLVKVFEGISSMHLHPNAFSCPSRGANPDLEPHTYMASPRLANTHTNRDLPLNPSPAGRAVIPIPSWSPAKPSCTVYLQCRMSTSIYTYILTYIYIYTP